MALVKTSKIAGSAAKGRRLDVATPPFCAGTKDEGPQARQGSKQGQGVREGGGGHGRAGERAGPSFGGGRGTPAVDGTNRRRCRRGRRRVAGAVGGNQAGHV